MLAHCYLLGYLRTRIVGEHDYRIDKTDRLAALGVRQSRPAAPLSALLLPLLNYI
jgi:hypothetical protein